MHGWTLVLGIIGALGVGSLIGQFFEGRRSRAEGRKGTRSPRTKRVPNGSTHPTRHERNESTHRTRRTPSASTRPTKPERNGSGRCGLRRTAPHLTGWRSRPSRLPGQTRFSARCPNRRTLSRTRVGSSSARSSRSAALTMFGRPCKRRPKRTRCSSRSAAPGILRGTASSATLNGSIRAGSGSSSATSTGRRSPPRRTRRRAGGRPNQVVAERRVERNGDQGLVYLCTCWRPPNRLSMKAESSLRRRLARPWRFAL